MREEKGFTLIEIIIVVVIMGAAIGLAAPRIGKSLEKMRLRSVVRKFSAVLRYTRQMAISRKKEYTVIILSNSDEKINKYKYLKVEKKESKKDFFSDSDGDEADVSAGNSSHFTEENIQEKPVTVDLEKIHISYLKNEEDEYEEGGYLEGGAGEIIFYPKGESTGGRVILGMEGIKLAFQVDIDPVTGRVKVKRKNEEE